MEEPDGGVDADAEASQLIGVGFEAVDDGEVVVGARLGCGSQYLRRECKSYAMIARPECTYVPETVDAHRSRKPRVVAKENAGRARREPIERAHVRLRTYSATRHPRVKRQPYCPIRAVVWFYEKRFPLTTTSTY